jgi:hypothetical protein
MAERWTRVTTEIMQRFLAVRDKLALLLTHAGTVRHANGRGAAASPRQPVGSSATARAASSIATWV